MQIWLTADLKAKHLQELAEAATADLDYGVMPLLSQINDLTGCVTTGCCAGHSRPMSGTGHHPFDRLGYVSIRTDEDKNDQMEAEVIPAILRQPFMDHVAKVYERDEMERLWSRFVFAFCEGCMEKFVYHFTLSAEGAGREDGEMRVPSFPIIIEVRVGTTWFPVEGADWSDVDTYKKHPPTINDRYDAWRAVVKATRKVLWERIGLPEPEWPKCIDSGGHIG